MTELVLCQHWYVYQQAEPYSRLTPGCACGLLLSCHVPAIARCMPKVCPSLSLALTLSRAARQPGCWPRLWASICMALTSCVQWTAARHTNQPLHGVAH
jgi:hypothetical protein